MNRVKVKQTITYTIRDKDGNIKKTETKETSFIVPVSRELAIPKPEFNFGRVIPIVAIILVLLGVGLLVWNRRRKQ